MTESVLAAQWLRRYRAYVLIALALLLLQLFFAYLLPNFATTDDALSSTNILPGQIDSHARLRQTGNEILADDEDIIDSNSILSLKDSVISKQQQQTASAKDQMDVGTNNAAATKQLTNQQQQTLQLDQLTFKPICEIVTKEAISAIHRAKTQFCKETIVNTTCAIEQNRFYASRLPNFCPSGGHVTNRALGCYKDEKKFRLLSGYYSNLKTQNTPERCIQLCLQSGFVYAGVQYS